MDQIWVPGKGTLPELCESAGLNPEHSCRVGTCATCETRLVRGSQEYEPEPLMEPGAGNIFICCALATSDIAIDL